MLLRLSLTKTRLIRSSTLGNRQFQDPRTNMNPAETINSDVSTTKTEDDTSQIDPMQDGTSVGTSAAAENFDAGSSQVCKRKVFGDQKCKDLTLQSVWTWSRWWQGLWGYWKRETRRDFFVSRERSSIDLGMRYISSQCLISLL